MRGLLISLMILVVGGCCESGLDVKSWVGVFEDNNGTVIETFSKDGALYLMRLQNIALNGGRRFPTIFGRMYRESAYAYGLDLGWVVPPSFNLACVGRSNLHLRLEYKDPMHILMTITLYTNEAKCAFSYLLTRRL